MDSSKNSVTIKIFIDGKSKFHINMIDSMTIEDLKNLLNDYIYMKIEFYISKNSLLDVFINNDYDNLKLKSIWSKIKDPAIVITTNTNKKDINQSNNTNINQSNNTNIKEITKSECIKVGSLRKRHGKDINLEKWLQMPNHLYVGRRGRIFIDKNIFHYPDSKWKNPYNLKEYSLEKSLQLYEKHVRENLINDIEELRGKTLGCFCDNDNPCHSKILIKILNEQN